MKKAQFGIEAFFAYFLFALAIIAVLAIILFPGMISKSKATETLEGTDLDERTMAELELDSYLRTDLPDNLPEVIEGIRNKGVDADINLDEAKELLGKNPEMHKNKNYADFISEIYYLESKERQNLFAAVTRAVFSEKINENIYDYPRISVVYNKFNTYYEQVDVSSNIVDFPSKIMVEQIIPIHGFQKAAVRLKKEGRNER